MKFIFLLFICCLALTANAHTYLTFVHNKTTTPTEGQYILPYLDKRISPVWDPMDQQLLCRTDNMNIADTEIATFIAGQNISIEWHESNPEDRAISPSHKGPCLAYLSPLEKNGKGPVWFKIHEEGLHVDECLWCTEKVILNKGKYEIPIPKDIKSGEYLLRTEVIALQMANKPYGVEDYGAEYFPNCAQINIIGGTGTSNPRGYEIPGIYKKDDKGILIDLFDGFDSYDMPGPPLYSKDQLPVVVNQEKNTPPLVNLAAKKPCTKRRRRLRKKQNV